MAPSTSYWAEAAEPPLLPLLEGSSRILVLFWVPWREKSFSLPRYPARSQFGCREMSHHVGATGNALSADNPPPSRRAHNPPHASLVARIWRELVFSPKLKDIRRLNEGLMIASHSGCIIIIEGCKSNQLSLA